jgi:hypothetical protein
METFEKGSLAGAAAATELRGLGSSTAGKPAEEAENVA